MGLKRGANADDGGLVFGESSVKFWITRNAPVLLEAPSGVWVRIDAGVKACRLVGAVGSRMTQRKVAGASLVVL
jgi:hypothetical protein